MSKEEKILRRLAPKLRDGINPDAILPYLMKYGITTREDEEILQHPTRTTRERNHRILECVLYGSKDLSLFLSCIRESANGHEPHNELAQILEAELQKQGTCKLLL